jgi:hypothetical protein
LVGGKTRAQQIELPRHSRCAEKEARQLAKSRGFGGRRYLHDKEGVFVLTSQEKWDKAKAQLEEVLAMLENNPTQMS